MQFILRGKQLYSSAVVCCVVLPFCSSLLNTIAYFLYPELPYFNWQTVMHKCRYVLEGQDWEQINSNNGPRFGDCQQEQRAAVTHSSKQWGVLLNICRDLPLNIHAVCLSRMCQPFCEKTKISIKNSILISLLGPSNQLPSPQSKGDLLLSLSLCHFSSSLALSLIWISHAPSDID